ncbi:hypothetical protein FQ142_07435 [Microbacterium sp. ANT_H45B]|uniref:antitoxin VbhA family protein n=1 Tax=Microbacterium sp. ANT_H45B TaxID=2597346 RepID=UPI0011EDD4BD|nr:antitoxin VbhA family protein [Microbacterium sp. ANT_H45B]KAA0960717.1 hypothetical protein FQ142_07435 [Microbacterium sp. ANT_H45B]
MTDPEEHARLARLQEIRGSMEELRIEALAERGRKTFTTEETLEFIRRQDLAADTVASWALEGLEPDSAVLERVQSYVEGEVVIEELIEQATRRASAGP